MSEVIQAYPLQWPAGWRRADLRKHGAFNKKERVYRDGQHAYNSTKDLNASDASMRVIDSLMRMGVERHAIVISTNLQLRRDGLPRSDYESNDPGAAVYWRKDGQARCMAIDVYWRTADNLAAIAASLEAMRAIERHGGALILDRVFQGFTALPAPEQWFTILGVSATATREQIEAAYRPLAMQHHPDRPGGNAEEMARINAARDEGLSRAR